MSFPAGIDDISFHFAIMLLYFRHFPVIWVCLRHVPFFPTFSAPNIFSRFFNYTFLVSLNFWSFLACFGVSMWHSGVLGCDLLVSSLRSCVFFALLSRWCFCLVFFLPLVGLLRGVFVFVIFCFFTWRFVLLSFPFNYKSTNKHLKLGGGLGARGAPPSHPESLG